MASAAGNVGILEYWNDGLKTTGFVPGYFGRPEPLGLLLA